MSKTIDFLLDIASENNGFKIGDPWRFHELSLTAIIPLVRATEAKRSYRLISEVQKDIKIRDTGSIDQMQITNDSDWPILVKGGEYVYGATQTRTLAVSQVILVKETVVVPCACVHSSKGIREGQSVKVDGYAPSEVREVLYRGCPGIAPHRPPYTVPFGGDTLRRRSSRGYSRGINYAYSGSLQQAVWGEVRKYSGGEQARVHGLMSRSRLAPDNDILHAFAEGLNSSYQTSEEDLAGRMRENEEKYKDILKKTPKLDNQVGLALVALDGLESLECFEHPESFEALRRQVLKSEAGKLAETSELFDFKPEKAKAIVKELLTGKYEEYLAVDKLSTSTTILTGKKFQGEVVLLGDDAIHCSFVKRAS